MKRIRRFTEQDTLDVPSYKKSLDFSIYAGMDQARGEVPSELLDTININTEDPTIGRTVLLWYIPEKGQLDYIGWTAGSSIKRIKRDITGYSVVSARWDGYFIEDSEGNIILVARKREIREADLVSGAEKLQKINKDIDEIASRKTFSSGLDFSLAFTRVSMRDIYYEHIKDIVEETEREIIKIRQDMAEKIKDKIEDVVS